MKEIQPKIKDNTGIDQQREIVCNLLGSGGRRGSRRGGGRGSSSWSNNSIGRGSGGQRRHEFLAFLLHDGHTFGYIVETRLHLIRLGGCLSWSVLVLDHTNIHPIRILHSHGQRIVGTALEAKAIRIVWVRRGGSRVLRHLFRSRNLTMMPTAHACEQLEHAKSSMKMSRAHVMRERRRVQPGQVFESVSWQFPS
jgi:hypothetical protein